MAGEPSISSSSSLDKYNFIRLRQIFCPRILSSKGKDIVLHTPSSQRRDTWSSTHPGPQSAGEVESLQRRERPIYPPIKKSYPTAKSGNYSPRALHYRQVDCRYLIIHSIKMEQGGKRKADDGHGSTDKRAKASFISLSYNIRRSGGYPPHWDTQYCCSPAFTN